MMTGVYHSEWQYYSQVFYTQTSDIWVHIWPQNNLRALHLNNFLKEYPPDPPKNLYPCTNEQRTTIAEGFSQFHCLGSETEHFHVPLL